MGDELCYDYGASDLPWRQHVFHQLSTEEGKNKKGGTFDRMLSDSSNSDKVLDPSTAPSLKQMLA